MRKDREVAAAMKLLQQINKNRPMSELAPRFSIFREALVELVHEGEIKESEIAYFTFCYVEHKVK